jgi:hypothetical protein
MSKELKEGTLPESFNPDWDSGVLTPQEIEKLETLVRGVFSYLAGLKLSDGLARHIQNPKIPPVLSESTVINIRSKLFPGSLGARLGGKKGDVLLRYADGERRAEVKATGENGFEAFSGKDVSADYLVWIHFGTFFRDGEGSVVLYKVERPGTFVTKGEKISIRPFLKRVPPERLEELKASSLTEIVRKYVAA